MVAEPEIADLPDVGKPVHVLRGGHPARLDKAAFAQPLEIGADEQEATRSPASRLCTRMTSPPHRGMPSCPSTVRNASGAAASVSRRMRESAGRTMGGKLLKKGEMGVRVRACTFGMHQRPVG